MNIITYSTYFPTNDGKNDDDGIKYFIFSAGYEVFFSALIIYV